MAEPGVRRVLGANATRPGIPTRAVSAADLGSYEPSPDAWADWQHREPALRPFDFLELRRALLRRDVSGSSKDAQLGALVRLGQHPFGTDPRLAVVVCLLPGLRNIVRRYEDILGPADAWAELVSAMWEQLGKYDLDRRPSRVAANLLWDCTSRLLRAVRRERAWRDHIDLFGLTENLTGCQHDSVTCVLDHVRTGGVLAPIDAVLIEATRLNGISLADAAMLLGMSYEAAKKRRQRAEAIWIAWWAPELLPTLQTPLQRAPVRYAA